MHDDPREELGELVRALRAHAEWQAVTGATGLPRATGERREAVAEAPPPVAEAPKPVARPEQPVGDQSVGEAHAKSEAMKRGGGTEPRSTTTRLQVIAAEVAACTSCRLHSTRTQTVFARGTGESGLCFVGEAPGADEDAQGYPFVGKAGQLLDRMIAAMGFQRDEVYVANIAKCRPPDNRKPEPDEMAACKPYLDRQLEIIAPQVIVALGATAVQGLLGTTEGITRLRGRWKLYKGRIAVMPTFHPAYLLRNPGAKRDVWTDLQAVLRQMGRPIP